MISGLPIDLELRPMKTLSKKSKEYICSCDEKCECYVYIDEYGRFCEKDAMKIAYQIIGLVKRASPVGEASDYRYWTSHEEQFIIDWYAKGFKKGDREIIAEMLGRTYVQTSNKIDHMRKVGRL